MSTFAVRNRLKLTLAEAKAYLRVDGDEENGLIEDLINSSLQKADEFLGNDFDCQTERVGRGDGTTAAFTVAKSPFYRVTKVEVDDAEISTDYYTADKTTGVITFTAGNEPADGARIDITYEAEFEIPSDVRVWCLRRIARHYENRTNGVSAQSDATGSVTWSKEDYDGIVQYRNNPGF